MEISEISIKTEVKEEKVDASYYEDSFSSVPETLSFHIQEITDGEANFALKQEEELDINDSNDYTEPDSIYGVQVDYESSVPNDETNPFLGQSTSLAEALRIQRAKNARRMREYRERKRARKAEQEKSGNTVAEIKPQKHEESITPESKKELWLAKREISRRKACERVRRFRERNRAKQVNDSSQINGLKDDPDVDLKIFPSEETQPKTSSKECIRQCALKAVKRISEIAKDLNSDKIPKHAELNPPNQKRISETTDALKSHPFSYDLEKLPKYCHVYPEDDPEQKLLKRRRNADYVRAWRKKQRQRILDAENKLKQVEPESWSAPSVHEQNTSWTHPLLEPEIPWADFTPPQPEVILTEFQPQPAENLLTYYTPPQPKVILRDYAPPPPEDILSDYAPPPPEVILTEYAPPQPEVILTEYAPPPPEVILTEYAPPQPEVILREYNPPQPEVMLREYKPPQPKFMTEYHPHPPSSSFSVTEVKETTSQEEMERRRLEEKRRRNAAHVRAWRERQRKKMLEAEQSLQATILDKSNDLNPESVSVHMEQDFSWTKPEVVSEPWIQPQMITHEQNLWTSNIEQKSWLESHNQLQLQNNQWTPSETSFTEIPYLGQDTSMLSEEDNQRLLIQRKKNAERMKAWRKKQRARKLAETGKSQLAEISQSQLAEIGQSQLKPQIPMVIFPKNPEPEMITPDPTSNVTFQEASPWSKLKSLLQEARNETLRSLEEVQAEEEIEKRRQPQEIENQPQEVGIEYHPPEINDFQQQELVKEYHPSEIECQPEEIEQKYQPPEMEDYQQQKEYEQPGVEECEPEEIEHKYQPPEVDQYRPEEIENECQPNVKPPRLKEEPIFDDPTFQAQALPPQVTPCMLINNHSNNVGSVVGSRKKKKVKKPSTHIGKVKEREKTLSPKELLERRQNAQRVRAYRERQKARLHQAAGVSIKKEPRRIIDAKEEASTKLLIQRQKNALRVRKYRERQRALKKLQSTPKIIPEEGAKTLKVVISSDKNSPNSLKFRFIN